MNRWPPIREAIRDIACIGLGLYIGFRAGQPPITLEDMPAFSAAAGFLGIPFVVRAKDE